MGLDMFAFKTKFKPSQEVDFQEELNGSDVEEIHYWRKHPNLHGWMEALYREKGGEGEDFNGDLLLLSKEDLDRLAMDLLATEPNMPDTSGFFFGKSTGSEEEIQNDLKFVKEAHRAIEEGYTVYYDSWW